MIGLNIDFFKTACIINKLKYPICINWTFNFWFISIWHRYYAAVQTEKLFYCYCPIVVRSGLFNCTYFNCNKANCSSVVKEIVIMTNRLSICLTILFVAVFKFDVVVSQASDDNSLTNSNVIMYFSTEVNYWTTFTHRMLCLFNIYEIAWFLLFSIMQFSWLEIIIEYYIFLSNRLLLPYPIIPIDVFFFFFLSFYNQWLNNW